MAIVGCESYGATLSYALSNYFALNDTQKIIKKNDKGTIFTKLNRENIFVAAIISLLRKAYLHPLPSQI